MLEKILQWDRETFIYLNSLGIEEYDVFWYTITNIGTWVPLFVLFGFLLFQLYPNKKAFAMTFCVLFLAFFIVTLTDLTKEVVARLRPNNETEINTLIRILKSPTNYSFFSGHAASSTSIATLMYLFLRRRSKWTVLFYIWPILFCTSRIYVGVHYPVDIIVGILAGLATSFLVYMLYKRLIVPYLGLSHP